MPFFRDKPKDVIVPETQAPTLGKGAPTPKRSQQVSRNTRPLVPADRKAAKTEARARMAAQRDEARRGFERGDERFLPARDKGEVRRFVRDFVDARPTIATLMIPVMIVVIAFTFLQDRQATVYANIGLWTFVLLSVLDCIVLGRQVNRRVTQKFGPGHTKGNTWYASMRAAQLPFMRMPKPQTKLFRFPE